MPTSDEIYDINARVYHTHGIAHHYSDDTLAREDASGLLKYQSAFANKDVLDIGVGSGRTSIYLAPLSHRYQAIDYSPAMLQKFKQNLPGVPIAQADMRDLSRFPDADFDFVLASNNVFDAVGHEDRLQILREIHRVLRPEGILMFSAHNRDVDGLTHGPRLYLERNPVSYAWQALHWCRALVNHMRLRKLQVFKDDYAIVNDEAHDCGLLQYYISPDAQRRQLAASGFELVEILDHHGAPVHAGERAAHSRWLLYVARRLAVS